MDNTKTVVRIPTEIYSRVAGYYRPVQNWNVGKQQEFSEREYFTIPESKKQETEKSCVA